jgi:hypothetical protein
VGRFFCNEACAGLCITRTFPGLSGNDVNQLLFLLPMQNLLAITIPPADLAKALDHFRQGAAVLAPYLRALTPEERQTMLKMADKTVASSPKPATTPTPTPASCLLLSICRALSRM